MASGLALRSEGPFQKCAFSTCLEFGLGPELTAARYRSHDCHVRPLNCRNVCRRLLLGNFEQAALMEYPISSLQARHRGTDQRKRMKFDKRNAMTAEIVKYMGELAFEQDFPFQPFP